MRRPLRSVGRRGVDGYLKVISDFASSLAKAIPLDDFVWTVCRDAVARLGFEDCVLYLLDDDEGNLVQKAAIGAKNPTGNEILEPIVIGVGDGIVGTVALTGVPEVIPDTKADPRYIVDDRFRRSELTVPLIHEGRVIGILDAEHPDKNFFNRDHLDAVAAIASMSAVKIMNTRAQGRPRPALPLSVQDGAAGRQGAAALSLLLGAANAGPNDDELLAVLSHELRTPLAAIMGFTELLQARRGLIGDQQELLRAIDRHGQQLLYRIESLLDLPQLVQGNVEPEVESVDIGAVIQNACSRYAQELDDADVDLIVEVPPSLAPLTSDAGRLEQILSNLIDNAVKFTERGSITVRAGIDEATGELTRIDVVDTGIGIVPEQAARIFEPFYQVDRGLGRKYDGLGLGLGIAKSLASDIGFELRVDSEIGKGSTFSLLRQP